MAWKSSLPQKAATIAARVDAACRASAEMIARDAKERAPVVSGDLRDAIHVERRAAAEYEVIAGSEDVFYAHFVEFGTTTTSARPFLVPAAEANRDTLNAAVRSALKGL